MNNTAHDKRLEKAYELLRIAAEAQEALWSATAELEIELEAVYGTRVELKAEEFQQELPLQDMLDARGLELPEEEQDLSTWTSGQGL